MSGNGGKDKATVTSFKCCKNLFTACATQGSVVGGMWVEGNVGGRSYCQKDDEVDTPIARNNKVALECT